MLMERNLIRVNEAELETYLNLYANEHSLQFDAQAIRGLNTLFEIGFKAGIYPDPLRVEEYLIPERYEALRQS
jgi:1,4-dihydroxy-6-naphthoate synthase